MDNLIERVKSISNNCKDDSLSSFLNSLLKGGYIRAVNYHNTPKNRLNEFKKDLKFFSENFTSVSEADLDQYFKTGKWHKSKPGLIISLFNGYRNNYDVFYPLLEEYGFVGWFFIATQFVDTPSQLQKEFSLNHELTIVEDEYDDGRYALDWDEIRELDKKHVVASHTKTHSSITLNCSKEIMRREIVESKEDLKKQLGHDISSFTWLFGEGYHPESEVTMYLKEAGYKYLFGNLSIEKIK